MDPLSLIRSKRESLDTASLTDLIALPRASDVALVPGGIVVCTPDRPDFLDGNMLILNASPASDSSVLQRIEMIGRTFPANVRTARVQTGSSTGDPLRLPAPVESRTFTLHSASRALLERSRPAVTEAKIREIYSRQQWDLLVETMANELYAGDLALTAWRYEQYRRQVQQGRGMWWLALDGDEIVGSAGALWFSDVARFQDVWTAPAWRNRKIWSALHGKILEALTLKGVSRFVIAAEASSPLSDASGRMGYTPEGAFQIFDLPREAIASIQSTASAQA